MENNSVMLSSIEGFDPNQWLIEIDSRRESGKKEKYLPVQARVLAFRLAHPMGRIETNIVTLDSERAVVEAKVYLSADVMFLSNSFAQKLQSKSETYLEDATTAAIGRALALAGYGTQFVGGELDTFVPVDSGVKQSDTELATASSEPIQVSNSSSTMGIPEVSSEVKSALAVKINFGRHKDKTMSEVMMSNSSNIVWLATSYDKNDDIKRAATLISNYYKLA